MSTILVTGASSGMGKETAKRLLREKGVLEAMENAIDMCERVGERLTNLAVKHG